MARIVMRYIVIRKDGGGCNLHNLITEYFDGTGLNRDESYIFDSTGNGIKYIIDNRHAFRRAYLELESTLRFDCGAKMLQILDNCLLKSQIQKDVTIIKCFDGLSALFCEKLFPKYALFERHLRQMVLLVLTKSFGASWSKKTISDKKMKDIKGKAKFSGSLPLSIILEQFDLGEMEQFLFDKREVDYCRFIENELSNENLVIMEKDEICNVIDEMRPKSLWENHFEKIGNQKTWKDCIDGIHEGRNKVAHNKTINYDEYKSIRKKIDRLNYMLVEANYRLRERSFEAESALDILTRFSKALDNMKEKLKGLRLAELELQIEEAMIRLNQSIGYHGLCNQTEELSCSIVENE